MIQICLATLLFINSIFLLYVVYESDPERARQRFMADYLPHLMKQDLQKEIEKRERRC